MVDRIYELVSPLGVTSERVRDLRAAARAIRAIQVDIGAPGIVVTGELLRLLPTMMTALDEADVSWRVPDDLDQARDAPLGVTLVEAAVVETGSVVLAEKTLGDRGVGLLSLVNIMLIPVDDVVPSLVEAAAIIREVALKGGYATLVTGPSRTADIEMSLTVGVQGPARVHYLFVESLR
jgi:L-lactate dehydrogenase complex protein LldG